MASSERFGYEWGRYSGLSSSYEEQFANWISPLTDSDLAGKRVLDAGCGMGRNSYWALKWGASSLVAVDLDPRSLEAARHNLKPFDSVVDVSKKDLHAINWVSKFDIVLCIGVLHHLEQPEIVLRNLYRALRPGGKLVLWVYGYEGNEWIARFVNPIRKFITSRLPVSLVHTLAYLCSLPLWIFLKLANPKNLYLSQLRTFPFWHVHSIVFDQLIPTIAYYWKEEEVQKMTEKLKPASLDIHVPPNGSGWTVIVGKSSKSC